MAVEVGAVVGGRITGITKFGAFVALPEGKSGLVHISEVANVFVADVNDFLHVGQEVRVRVMSIAPDGKINLSVKRAEDGCAQTQTPPPRFVSEAAPKPRRSEPPRAADVPLSDEGDFEDRLRKFMKESDSRIAQNPMYADRPRRGSRRGK